MTETEKISTLMHRLRLQENILRILNIYQKSSSKGTHNDAIIASFFSLLDFIEISIFNSSS